MNGKRRLDDEQAAGPSEATKKAKPQPSFDLDTFFPLLDFSSTTDISARFDEIADALLNELDLVVHRGTTEAVLRLLEVEFYLWKEGVHEDPFTHGSVEQSQPGRWYFHRAPRSSKDANVNLTSTTGYRGGSRKGLDLTIAGHATSTSPYFEQGKGGEPARTVAKGGILLRAIQHVSDDTVVCGPCLLVDTVLKLSGAPTISELVSSRWKDDISARRVIDDEAMTSMTLRPRKNAVRHVVHTSPRIGLDLSHPGVTPTATHLRVIYLTKPYRYLVRPTLLSKNRHVTVAGLLMANLSTHPVDSAEMRKLLEETIGVKASTLAGYLEAYSNGLDAGHIDRFVGQKGKGAASSPLTYMAMLGTIERLRGKEADDLAAKDAQS